MQTLMYLFLASFFTLSASAEPKREVIHVSASVSLYPLYCLTPIFPGSEKGGPITQLGGRFGQKVRLLVHGGESPLKLEHDSAVGEGCDLAVLKDMAAKAREFFGFRHGVKAEIIHESSDPQRAPNGQCYQLFQESLKLDLGEGVVLKSHQQRRSLVEGCGF